MPEHICDKCNRSFKYLSYLKRHQTNKKDCSQNIQTNNETIIDDKQVDIDDEISNDDTISKLTELAKNIDNPDNKKKMIDIIEDIKNKMKKDKDKDNDKDKKDEINKIDHNKDKHDKSDKYKCPTCNHCFYDRQGLYKHKKLKRCKGIIVEQVVEQVNIIDNSVNNHIVNNIDNRIINNITININPFKCESLDHITLEDFKNIYNTISNIDSKLCYFIYHKNKENIYFFKNNLKYNIVSFINDKMELQSMDEPHFIKELIYNINESKIELFHIFKNDLTEDEMLNYMKNMIIYHNNYDRTPSIRKSFETNIKLFLDTVYRNKTYKDIIEKINDHMEHNPEIKASIHELKKQILLKKKNIIKEYSNPPPDDNEDNKNLNLLKTRAEHDIDQLMINLINVEAELNE